MHEALYYTVYNYTNAFNLHNNSNEIDTLIIFTLQMRKPSLREVKEFGPSHRAEKWQSGSRIAIYNV